MNTPTAHFAAEPQYVPHDERRNHGKSLRDAGPREPHGHWKPANDRHDIVDHLVASNEGRMQQLVPFRFGRMMRSPFTFIAARPGSWQPTDRIRGALLGA